MWHNKWNKTLLPLHIKWGDWLLFSKNTVSHPQSSGCVCSRFIIADPYCFYWHRHLSSSASVFWFTYYATWKAVWWTKTLDWHQRLNLHACMQAFKSNFLLTLVETVGYILLLLLNKPGCAPTLTPAWLLHTEAPRYFTCYFARQPYLLGPVQGKCDFTPQHQFDGHFVCRFPRQLFQRFSLMSPQQSELQMCSVLNWLTLISTSLPLFFSTFGYTFHLSPLILFCAHSVTFTSFLLAYISFSP